MQPKRDLRVQKTYKALIDAFLKMLEETSFEKVTVNELCNRAMVRRATFYKHFADKYDFFEFVVREIQGRFLERNSLDEGGYEAFYCVTIQSVFDFVEENRVLITSVVRSGMFLVVLDVVSEQTVLSVKERLEQDERQGVVFPASPAILSQLFTGALINVVKWWMNEESRIPKEEAVTQVTALLLRDIK